MNNETDATLFDRFAVGLMSGFLAAISYGVLWSGFVLLSDGDFLLPIELFFTFIIFMFLLGFFTLDNYFIDILSPLWHFIARIFG